MAPEIAAKQVSIALELQASDEPIFGDPVQLQQLVLNLITNAVEALDASGLGDKQVVVTSRCENTAVIVEVRDSGPGLSQQDIDQVFDPFYTTKDGGMGMGLAICRSIVEAHGGTLGATSDQRRETVFAFRIPLMIAA